MIGKKILRLRKKAKLTQEQLARTLLPLGDMTKEQARSLAKELGLINADKRDSQDICFIPDGDYAKFIELYTGQKSPSGNYIDMNGNVLGKHKGIINYTIGQRKGLGLALGEPMYVIEKDIEKTIRNLGKIGSVGMQHTDDMILDIMVCK